MRDDASSVRPTTCAGNVRPFDNVIVGVKDLDGGRDPLWLAGALASRNRRLTLAHVQVVAAKPAPDSGSARSAAMRRYALERLTALRDESQLEAEPVCAEARGVRQGLHALARARDADLLVSGASRQDEIAHDEYGGPASELRRYGRSVDLLVLGSHKHSPIGRLLGAGTAQRLADERLCPLLVVEQG